MKKFVIISIILLLIGGTAFGFSLKHYLDVKHPSEETSDESSADSEETPDTPEEATEAQAAPVNNLADNGIFSANYAKAQKAIEEMSDEEMVGQLIVGVCSDLDTGTEDIKKYSLAGFLFESDAFSYKTDEEIKQGIAGLKKEAKIAPIVAAQEEGGERTTVSGSDAFPENTYDSPRNILASGGLQDVEKTELEKATFLKEVGFNLNLAPVVDIPDSSDQMMYSRSLTDDEKVVSDFAKYCSKQVQAKGVSIALKHFPGYGTISDEANYEAQSNGTPVVDDRMADDIRNKDYAPFKSGAEEGAHFIMVSNVIVKGFDATHTAALSPTVHKELRDSVGFTGLIITDIIDDADYSAYADGRDVAVAAILAGNDLVLSRNYSSAYTAILSAVNDGTISRDLLQQTCTRILAYKYTAGLIK